MILRKSPEPITKGIIEIARKGCHPTHLQVVPKKIAIPPDEIERGIAPILKI
jgi:hypothetical protein